MRLTIYLLASLFALPSVHANQNSTQKSSSQQASNPSAGFSRRVALPKWAQVLAPIPATERKEPVVYRLNETQAWVGAVSSVLVNRAIQVNDQNAIGVIGQFGMSYYPTYQKLTMHRVAILRGSQTIDHTATVNTRFLQRETSMENGVVGGATTVQLLLNDVRVGDTLWVTYSVDGENPVFGKRWSGEYSWDIGSSIELRRLTVMHPKSRPLHWRQMGDFQAGKISPTLEQMGDTQKLVFEERGIEAVEGEPSIPTHYFPVRALQFSEYADWQSVATWADSLFPKIPASAELKKIALDINKKASALEKASAALQWVQNEVRYFSVSIGENSHRPQSPDTVIRRRYGDCKDKSYLLVSLLRELGIEATPLLLSAQAPLLPARTLPSPISFDHVIVQVVVDGQSYYVDPTRNGQNVPIQTLAIAFPGAATLPVDGNAKELLTLPTRPDVLPLYEHVENIVIADFDGDATLETREIYRGSYAEWARQRFPSLTVAEFKKAMLALYEKQYPGVTLLAPPSYQDHPAENRFELIIRYNLPKPITHTEKRYAFEYDSQIIYNTLGIPDNIVRNFPLQLPVNNYRGRYRLKLTWPKNVRENFAPKAKTLDNPYFNAHEEYTIRGNHVDYLMDYQVKVKEVNAKEVPMLQKEAKRLVEFTTGKFYMLEASLRSEELAAFTYQDFDNFVVMTDFVTLASSPKESMNREMSKAEACDLVLTAFHTAELTGQKYDLTGEKIEAIVRSGLEQSHGKLCLARYLFSKGHFADSIPLFHEEKPLADNDPHMKDLAWAKFYVGDKDGAVVDMSRFRATQEKLESTSNYGLDLASEIALWQRSGKPPSEKVLAYAKGIPDGPWPRPLLAMQVGIISETELIKSLDSLPKDTREIALNEAWYYLGQKYLAEKNQVEAERLFGTLRKSGLRSSGLRLQALAELERFVVKDDHYIAGVRAYESGDDTTAVAQWKLSAAAGFVAAKNSLGRAYYFGEGVRQDYKTALLWLTQAAMAGNAEAQNFVGAMHQNGEGTAESTSIALDWYRKAAEQGNMYAQFNLGKFYHHGIEVKKDLNLAFSYFLMAAEQGYDEAQVRLGYFYTEGLGVKQDYTQALRWNLLASSQNNADGMVQLANQYAMGLGCKRNGKGALHWLEQAAKQGHLQAVYGIGTLYEYGIDVVQDYRIAAVWYEKAAKEGNIDATAKLMWLSLEKKDVTTDVRKGFNLLKNAALSGHDGAQFYLAHMYQEGIGTSKDEALATHYFQLAAEQGNKYAQEKMGNALHSGLGIEKNLTAAHDWYRKAAEQGNPSAQFSLANMLNNGFGVELNQTEAMSWFRKSADQGNLDAMNNLGDIYEVGIAVPQDYTKAIELYEKAANLGGSWGLRSLGSLFEKGLGKPRDEILAYTYFQIATKLNKVHQTKRDKAALALSEDERKKADEIAANWKAGLPLPTRQ